MTTETEVHREVALLPEHEPLSGYACVLRDVALVSCAVASAGLVEGVAEVGELNSRALQYLTQYVVRETAVVTSTAARYVHPHRVIRDLAFTKSASLGACHPVEEVSDVALLSSAYVTKTHMTERDVAQLRETLSKFVTARRLVRDGAQVHGVDRSDRVDALLSSTGVLSTASYDSSIYRVVQIETSQLSSALSNNTKWNQVVRDVAFLSTAPSRSQQSRAIATDTNFLYSRAVAPATGVAYTCTIITWGMSKFRNFPFLSMSGTNLAGSNLWRFTSSKDNGTNIESYVKTGVLDMGQSHNKRMTALYATGSSTAPLTLKVTGDLNGDQQTYTYTLDLRDQTEYRNNRALIGKGFRSRYVQLQLGTTGTTQYRLVNAEVDVAVSQRRL